VICPGCQRDNHPRRRYCGRCGCNFDPICRACSFVNDGDDRFCGGCGATLGMEVGGVAPVAPVPVARTTTGPGHRAHPAHPAHPVAPAPAVVSPVQAAAALPVDELAGLFAPRLKANESPQLPDTGIVQGDLDRLFGGAQ
jgi:hypothetical protein